MQRLIMVLVVFIVLVCPGSQAPGGDLVKDDMAKLQGTWVGVKIISRGKEIESDEVAKFKYVFADPKVTIYRPKGEPEGPQPADP